MSTQRTNPTFTHTPKSLLHAVIHVFFPSDPSDWTNPNIHVEDDFSLVRAVYAAAHAFSTHTDGTSESQWQRITNMLENLQASVKSEHLERERIISQLCGMQTGDVLAFFIRSQGSGILLTKRETSTISETFDVVGAKWRSASTADSPLISPSAVEESNFFDVSPQMEPSVAIADSPLICSYPMSAVAIPNHVFDDADFQHKLTSFISLEVFDLTRYGQFVTSVYNDILQGVGNTADVPLITKHIRTSNGFWIRSPLWLLIKVVIQMSLDRSPLGRGSYKEFLLFFMCTLASDANVATLHTDILHFMACKIQWRLSKLGSSIPEWLFQTIPFTLEQLSIHSSPSPFQNPSQDELERDTRLSLTCSQDYIRNALANHNCEPPPTAFHPDHRHRGTIHDFLSSNGTFFKEAYSADPEVTLYDVAKAVEEDIDDWIANVVDVDEACHQIEILMDRYLMMENFGNTDGVYVDIVGKSIITLTVIELFIALDKLIVKEIPILANYSPEVPAAVLESLALRNETSLHRTSRAYSYLSARQTQSHLGWSVLSNEDSLPVRFYDQSLYLQQLKAKIEQEGMINIDVLFEDHQRRFSIRHTEDVEGTWSPLPVSPFHAKVVVFELQCPASIRIWRSAAALMWYYFSSNSGHIREGEEEENLICRTSALRKYYVEGDVRLPLKVEVQLPTLRYVVRFNKGREFGFNQNRIFIWEGDQHSRSWNRWWRGISEGYPNYTKDTSHTPNDVLAAQADCPADISLDEFLVGGQLRSGGSLQWLNILHGLRSRTLNLRRYDVFYLLSCAVFQVGPLDLDTGTWFWHKDLQDLSFCNALLDELESVFTDIGSQLIDTLMMHNISLLLTGVLASAPSEGILQRVISLLRRVRRKMLDWTQELSYNLGVEPLNDLRKSRFPGLFGACLSTFDVGTATLWKQFQSEEDIGVALSCVLLTHRFCFYATPQWPHCKHLCITLERALSDAILSDATDRGIDSAVRIFFPSHRPGASKWVKLEYPNARWLTCRTRESIGKPSQTVHLNLLDGELQIDGKSVSKLYDMISAPDIRQGVSLEEGFFVLPRMDPSNQGMVPKQKVHVFLRDNNLTVQVQCNDSKDTFEWIPSDILEHDLPPALLDGHTHWLSLSRGVIEIRPRERPLDSSSEDWRIDFASGQYRAYKGSETLVDIRSPTWTVVSHCFKCLNALWGGTSNNYLVRQSNDLIITTFPITSPESPSSVLRLSVVLPRFGLSFLVNEQGDLESCDFKDMVYDSLDQIETLSRIEHLFLLQQTADLPEGLIPKRILVPDGSPITYNDQLGHLCRFQSHGSTNESAYHVVDMDAELGCLTGNGNLRSTGLLAYIHAATSQEWPDPFTGKTGVQAAVSLLCSGICRSIARFKYLPEFGADLHSVSSILGPEVETAYQDIQERYYWKHSTRVYESDERRTVGQSSPSTQPPSPSIFLLFSNRPAPGLPPRSILPCDSYKISSENAPASGLNRLFPSLEVNQPCFSFHQEYVARLSASALNVRKDFHVTYSLSGRDRIDTLKKHYLRCRVSYFDALEILKERLCPSTDSSEQVVGQPDQWLPITGDTLLRYLASTLVENLPYRWKKCLTSLALLLLDLQRARRLLRFALEGLEEEFSKELENEGCDGWDPDEYPDWLLIQIQGNFLIRRNQAEVAMEMISPKSGRNTVMQVNMGEGKSSVIIPIAAAVLADGKQLVRVIVPKALTVQMFDLLVARLGGLVNRPIYHLPFSRTPEYDDEGKVISLQIDDMHKLMSQCMAEHGILLLQPEHVVSLKLICIEEQISNRKPAANPSSNIQKSFYEHIRASSLLTSLPENSFVSNILQQLRRSRQKATARECDEPGHSRLGHGPSGSTLSWMSLQKWMDSHVRDILDESDEILHSRFQLIYTIGLEQHMEGRPDRWTIIQQVLRLVNDCFHALAPNYPDSFQIECEPGSFPHISIASGSNIGGRLKPLIVEYVMAGRIPSLDFRSLSQELRDAIRSFISDEETLLDTRKRVEVYAQRSDQASMWSSLLLLRGLLAFNILLFALVERRWRVDYGLVLQSPYFGRRSTKLAVPYRAKDMPAPNTQFGHPDITIILTCLSYYYSGLSEAQLRTSFEILLSHDDPYAEYAFWVKDYSNDTLPESLRTLGEINVRSSEQWDKVMIPLFSRNQATIDLFLSHMVFPMEAKEFPFKLSTSSWDLVGKREKLITGFSGTDDGRWLLPMSIDQRDIDHQGGANARVLEYLLQPENDFYISTADENGERWTTPEFVQMVARQQPEIRVLLDVGAQILDSSNRHVAEAWLDIVRDAAGAIYFDEKDELTVLMRNGEPVPMLSSSLAQQLGRCVVYLDHAHTRGTDLKLPIGSRAAVTLGPRLTKDRLVQGCMRMRKLGWGHSVIFFAPPEVDMSIRLLKRDPNSEVTTTDILSWAIHETWTDIQRRAPYWAQQGMSYRSRENAWSRFCNKEITSEQLSNVWLQPASKSLEDLYAHQESNRGSSNLSVLDSDIQQRCKDLGIISLSCVEIEEQEREVNREREREREEELPPKALPAEHFLHPDVVAFVTTGILPPLHSDSAFRPIFTTLEMSSAATSEADVWSPSILATTDFCNTIIPESTKGTIDQYLRPVQWVVSSKRDRVLVLMSPFEVNLLIRDIRASEDVHLHMYAPRTSYRMKPSDDLKLYTIPPLPLDWTPPWDLIDQLNVFSGQLYLRDHQSYLRLCRFLQVPTGESPDDAVVRRNLFKIPGSFEDEEITFSGSPLHSVMALLAIRCRGRPLSHTHMGKILYGQLLRERL